MLVHQRVSSVIDDLGLDLPIQTSDGACPIHALGLGVFRKPDSRLSYQRLPGLLWSEELKSFRDFRPLVGHGNVVAVAFW